MTPKRLLVIEDDAGLARALARLLRSYGHEVVVAGSCAEARAAAGKFSLAVFDIELPDGSGVDLARDLLDSGAVKRAVFFTGTHETEVLHRAAAMGPMITKARGVAVLRIAIENQLDAEAAAVAGDTTSQPVATSTAPPPSTVKRRDS